MKFTIQNYGPKWSEEHKIFADNNYGGRRKRKNPDYIYWKFRGKEGEEMDTFILAIDEEGKVAGQLGLIPTKFWLNNESFDIYWACELMVDPQYRGQGVASALYRHASNKRIVFGSKPSPKASKSMRNFGFKTLQGPKLVFIHSNIIESFNWVLQKINLTSNLSIQNPSIHLARFITTLSRSKIKVLSSDESIERASTLFQSEKNRVNFIHFDRDEDFLNWRFLPFKDYQKSVKGIESGKSFVLYFQDNVGNIYVGESHFENAFKQIKLAAQLICRMAKNKGKFVFFNIWNKKELPGFLLLGYWMKPRNTDIIYMDSENILKNYPLSRAVVKYTFFDSDERL